MTRLERIEKARVERALAWAARRVRTPLVFYVSPMTEREQKRYAGAALTTARSVRGDDDPVLFAVSFNLDETRTLNRKDLRRLAGHEVMHCLLFPLGEAADEIALEEAVVYVLQRAFFGEVGEP